MCTRLCAVVETLSFLFWDVDTIDIVDELMYVKRQNTQNASGFHTVLNISNLKN